MIILDTSVLSELMRPTSASSVLSWLDRQETTELFITSITQAELLIGLALLPRGRRRVELTARVLSMLQSEFDDRILAFDADAAGAYARICDERRSTGRPIATLDAQIAAIAQTHSASIATRNAHDFSDCGVDVVNPWLENPG